MPFDFACPDWFDRLQAGETPIADFELDEKAADEAIGIFNFLRLPDVPGTPALEDCAGDWMRDIVRAVFGSVERKPGPRGSTILERGVGEVFVLVPKKNAKTTSAAAIALTFMLLNKRPHADMLIIGPTQKISDVAFEQAKGMIEADPEGYLQDRFQIQDHRKTIVDTKNKTRLMVRTFGTDVLTGAKPIFTLIDEVHILGSISYAADVMRQIRGGMYPFPESLLFMITTQSDHPPAGLFLKELNYARGVRDGRITGARLLPVLYEFPEELQTSDDEAWRDPALWPLVTPNLGLSITIERLIEGLARAEEDGPDEVIGWATQHLNVEVGLALHANRWLGADFWQDAAEPGLSLETIIATSDVCTIGIDGGGMDDLFSLAVIGRHAETKRWQVWAKAWANEIVLERRKKIAPRLLDFAKAGDLVIWSEPETDVIEAADICERLFVAGLLPEKYGIGLDSYGIASLLDELERRGIGGDLTMSVGQGWKLQTAVQTLPRKLKDRTMVHCGAPLMAWSIGNAKAEMRGSNVVITKEAAGVGKIDPLVALFNAAMLMFAGPQPNAKGRLNDFLFAPVMAMR